MAQVLLDRYIYSDFLIVQSQNATATGLSHLLEGSISHDQVTRFLNKNVFDSKDLWNYVKIESSSTGTRKKRSIDY